MRILALTGVAAALLAGGSPAVAVAGAGAAPTYVTSDPAPGEQRDSPPDEVTITFSEPLDDSSRALVLDACDRRIDDRASEVFANELSVGIATTPSGEYRVFYEATGVGGATGTTRGAFGFEVTTGPSCGGHEAHGEHGNGGGKHGGGNGHGGDGDHGEGHDGDHDATAGDHADHSGTSVAAHGDHAGDEPHAGDHGEQGRAGDHGERGDDVGAARELQADRRAEADLAAAPGEAEADGAALVLALGLATALGMIGGWFLRASTPG